MYTFYGENKNDLQTLYSLTRNKATIEWKKLKWTKKNQLSHTTHLQRNSSSQGCKHCCCYVYAVNISAILPFFFRKQRILQGAYASAAFVMATNACVFKIFEPYLLVATCLYIYSKTMYAVCPQVNTPVCFHICLLSIFALIYVFAFSLFVFTIKLATLRNMHF